MTKKKFNISWLHDHLNDPYVKQARHDGYRTRAAYKLKEIDEQDDLIRSGQVIVDLGAAPGSWSQYVLNILRDKSTGKSSGTAQKQPGTLIALDRLPMEPLPGITFIQGDFREEEVLQKLRDTLGPRRVDLVISDMAPNLSGVAAADTAGMEHLCDLVLEFAQEFLTSNGRLLMKCFHGSGYSQIVERFKRHFQVVASRKPKASRDSSAEIFILAKGLKVVKQEAQVD